jgi:6-phosphogluconolactonase
VDTVVLPDPEAVAREAARLVAAEARAAVAARGRFVMAVSGGRTPWQMLRVLRGEDLPWRHVRLAQVDERVAPPDHVERNLTHLRSSLQPCDALRADQIHPMPVEAHDLEAAAADYAKTLEQLTESPTLLDLVHLGLGTDGHTASLIPGDPVLEVVNRDVALTGVYQGRRRMTLTYPVINRARRVLWIVTGSDKAAMLDRLRAGDESIPAGRVRQQEAVLLVDRQAAGQGAYCSEDVAGR